MTMQEVTDLKYKLDSLIIQKIDLMLKRCEQTRPKKDALLEIEGSEGEGKTNTSAAIAYYIKSLTNRPIHLFFKLEKMIKFAQTTERKTIIWDEPALDALSSDWFKETNKNVIRLLMTARKNRHFFIFNLTKFFKFSEYIVVDRALGMIHMFSAKQIRPGCFHYIRKHNLENLYNAYRTSKRRQYLKYSSFSGHFDEVLEDYFSKMGIAVEEKENATYEDYDKAKDDAIRSIGNEIRFDKRIDKNKLQYFKYLIASLKYPITDIPDLAKKLGIVKGSIYKWGKLTEEKKNQFSKMQLFGEPNNSKTSTAEGDGYNPVNDEEE